jgi:hypothetical protein
MLLFQFRRLVKQLSWNPNWNLLPAAILPI